MQFSVHAFILNTSYCFYLKRYSHQSHSNGCISNLIVNCLYIMQFSKHKFILSKSHYLYLKHYPFPTPISQIIHRAELLLLSIINYYCHYYITALNKFKWLSVPQPRYRTTDLPVSLHSFRNIYGYLISNNIVYVHYTGHECCSQLKTPDSKWNILLWK